MKSGNIYFLEPSGPLQACNGTVLLIVSSYAALGVSANDRLLFTNATLQGNTLAIVSVCVVIYLKIMCVIIC